MSRRLVHHILENSAERYPDKIALVCGEKKYTYRYLNHKADIIASALQRMGIKPHDRVVIFLESSVESVIALFAILKIGGIFVIVNPLLKARKLRYMLSDTGAVMLISALNLNEVSAAVTDSSSDFKQADYHATAPATLPLKHLVLLGFDSSEDDSASFGKTSGIEVSGWTTLLNHPVGAGARPSIIDVDLAALIYTSSSTGAPKGVMSTHYNILSVVASIDQYLQTEHSDIILNVLPLSFDYGLYQIFLSFYVGATVILAKMPVYPYQLLELIRDEGVTVFPIVPTIATILLRVKSGNQVNPAHLRYITNTGDHLTRAMIEHLRALFPRTDIIKMYGLTECKRATYLPPDQITLRPDSVGIPIPNCQAWIVAETGLEVGPNEIGELVIRGNNVMQGYWNQPDETDRVFKPNRYRADTQLYTGDYFKKDEDGYLYMMGRKDDLIKVKGQMISLKEIESFLDGIEGVFNSQVISIPNDLLGRYVVAYLVKDLKVDLQEKDVLALCTENLDPNIVPKKILFLESFPVTPNGKIDRKFLSEIAISS